MLSPEEFAVGTVEDAPPGSIVLPRGKYASVVLICEGEEAPVAVFSGRRTGSDSLRPRVQIGGAE